MTTLPKQSTATTKAVTVKPKPAPKKTTVKSDSNKPKAPVSTKTTIKPTAHKPVATTVSATQNKTITPTTKMLASKPESKMLKVLKPKKVKLVRDSFTIPKPEYIVLDDLKLRAAELKHPVKKGELLRAGIKALAAMTTAQFHSALLAVPALKTGRPSK